MTESVPHLYNNFLLLNMLETRLRIKHYEY